MLTESQVREVQSIIDNVVNKKKLLLRALQKSLLHYNKWVR